MGLPILLRVSISDVPEFTKLNCKFVTDACVADNFTGNPVILFLQVDPGTNQHKRQPRLPESLQILSLVSMRDIPDAVIIDRSNLMPCV